MQKIKRQISVLKTLIGKKLDEKKIFRHRWESFDKKLSKKRTIIMPHISDIHDKLISYAFDCAGYSINILPTVELEKFTQNANIKKQGACFLDNIIAYQILNCLKHLEFEEEKVTIMLTQTEGVCDIMKFKKYLTNTLKDAGYKDVQIVTLDIYNLNKQVGLRLASIQFKRIITALMYSDILTMMSLKVKPYIKSNDKEAFMFLLELWIKRCKESLIKPDIRTFEHDIFEMTEDYNAFPIDKGVMKQTLGVVGDSFVIENLSCDELGYQGVEIARPYISDFLFFDNYKKVLDDSIKDFSKLEKVNFDYISQTLNSYKESINENLERNIRYYKMLDIEYLSKQILTTFPVDSNNIKTLLNLIKILGLIESGVEKIILYRCSDCFTGTLGKKIIKKIKTIYQNVEIIQMEYNKNFITQEEVAMLASVFTDDFKKDKQFILRLNGS